MQLPDNAPFDMRPDPDMPGWYVWELKERGLYNDLLAPTRVRRDADGRGRVRIWPGRALGNTRGAVHGGTILGFADISLFGGAVMAGAIGAVHAVTLDCAVQFLNPGRIGEPLDAVVEIMRETARLVFLRGEMVQGEQDRVAAFTGIIRKTGPA